MLCRLQQWSAGLALAAVALLLSGCLSVDKKVAARIPEVQEQWRTNVTRQMTLPTRVVDWPEALKLAMQNNLKLREARMNITNNMEAAQQVYRDLIPTINLRSGITRSFDNFASTTVDDVTFNIDSFFNVPGVVNFDSRLFGAKLGLLRAHTGYHLAQREQTIELYKLFIQSQEEREIMNDLRSERTLAEKVAEVDRLTGLTLLREVQGRQLALTNEVQNFQERIGEVLGDRSFNWVLTTNGLPELDYTSHPLVLDDTNRVAQLQLKLLSIELVGAWAQIHGIKLRYWPELAIFVSGPSIYQRSSGMESFWDSGDASVSLDFFWTIDTRGVISQQLRQTRREQELREARLRQETMSLIKRLLAAQSLNLELQHQMGDLDQLISILDELPQETDFAAILQGVETNRALKRQRLRLRRESAELNSLFWFVDEQKWAQLN